MPVFVLEVEIIKSFVTKDGVSSNTLSGSL